PPLPPGLTEGLGGGTRRAGGVVLCGRGPAKSAITRAGQRGDSRGDRRSLRGSGDGGHPAPAGEPARLAFSRDRHLPVPQHSPPKIRSAGLPPPASPSLPPPPP